MLTSLVSFRRPRHNLGERLRGRAYRGTPRQRAGHGFSDLTFLPYDVAGGRVDEVEGHGIDFVGKGVGPVQVHVENDLGQGIYDPDGGEEHDPEPIIPENPENERFAVGAQINILSWKIVNIEQDLLLAFGYDEAGGSIVAVNELDVVGADLGVLVVVYDGKRAQTRRRPNIW